MLRGPRVTLRRGHVTDAEALVAVLQAPAVARWWGDYGLERVRKEVADCYVIVIDGEIHGWVFCEEESDPDYRHVGFDVALSPAVHGHGYGSEALRVLIKHHIERGHHRFTIDPAAGNAQAIRAYRAVGFRPVGLMRAYERGPDGVWHDNLLMDLLVDEFRA